MITVDFKRLGIKPGDRILDMGCGEGRHTTGAYELPGVHVTGADLSFADLKKTEGKLNYHDDLGAHGGGSWNLSNADITKLPFLDNSFDVVICSEVLEHIPDDKAAMSELIRVLKPGKPLVVSVPRSWPEKICWSLCNEYANTPGGHLRIYEKERLVRLLEKSGTSYRGSHYAHGLHSPFWWMKCVAGIENEKSIAVNLYHRMLVWDLMEKPKLTKFIEKIINPFFGKSVVLYMQKQIA